MNWQTGGKKNIPVIPEMLKMLGILEIILLMGILTGCAKVDYAVLKDRIEAAAEEAGIEMEEILPRTVTESGSRNGPDRNAGTDGGISTENAEPVQGTGYTADDLEKLIPHYELRYFLHDLKDEMKENFLTVYLTVAAYQDCCVLPHKADEEDLEILQYLLNFECPELLHFPGSRMDLWEMNQGSEDSRQEIHIAFNMSEEESRAQYKQCQSVVEAIRKTAEKETDGSASALEKYAYDYLTSRIYYSIEAPDSGNAFGALVSNQAKCDGISLGMKWVCEEMGIPCLILAGQENGDPVGHAWNIIGIDGDFYDVDVTLDVQGEGKPAYNLYPAFNVSRNWIRDNFPVMEVYCNHFVIPGSVTMEKSHHAQAGEFFRAGESCWQHYCDALDDALANDKHVIMMQFEARSDYSGFISTVSNMHQDWANSRRKNISSNMVRNERYRTVSMEVSFR